MDFDSAFDLLENGGIDENIIGGAILYHATGGKCLLDAFSGVSDEVVVRNTYLPNGSVRETKSASNAAQIINMSGLGSIPDNLDELLQAGLDLGIPVTGS